ncbi:bifunctional DNA-formamidopyrimidine glycosylase/DNA-(apurinic or apyrimidinic site) lyase [Patescibacteria group bacterium]|nr:bifunctional DNA-formamidopyrimidine glycosylase/DNA-(apurinic or apyrimidinic site) lyase [Patescibacteria group bacterium]
MPELPEVHTITQDLKKNILDFEIKNIKIYPNYKIPSDVKKKLISLYGKKIQNVDRIAKNIVIEISKDLFLVFHLAMTGRILLRQEGDKTDSWVKIVFEIEKNGDKKYLKFCDMRQFGKIQVLNKKELELLENKYGISVLDSEITPDKFLEALKSKKTNIKNALLDQKIVSGLGNIYATDALFLANINPKTSTQNLNTNMTEKLLKSSREILNEGIKNRGSTLPDKMYVDIFGKGGNQQNYFKIYGKKVCPVCNSKVEFEKINGRGTYFCPTCQPDIAKDFSAKKSKVETNKISEQKKLL